MTNTKSCSAMQRGELDSNTLVCGSRIQRFCWQPA